MIYCAGTHCSRKHTCELHNITNQEPNEVYVYQDYSTTGSGGANVPDSYDCGDLSKNYYRYKLRQTPADEEYLSQALFKIGIKLYDINGNRKSFDIILGELAEALAKSKSLT